METLQCTKTLNTKIGKSIYSLAIAGNYLLSGTYDHYIFVSILIDIVYLINPII
jgi:hypothetical protein